MIIATPFDKTNGKIFSHFGKSELFKVFTLEDNKIISSELVECEESGHNALAVSLVNNDVDLVICDGIGDGATDALSAAGIEIISGAKGDPEEAIKAYLAGELTSSGVNCENNDSECCADAAAKKAVIVAMTSLAQAVAVAAAAAVHVNLLLSMTVRTLESA